MEKRDSSFDDEHERQAGKESCDSPSPAEGGCDIRSGAKGRKIAVIGAGVSGLCAAVELKRKGFDVTVIEKSKKPGGVIGTFSKDGFLAESGSNTVMVNSRKSLEFFKSLAGAGDRMAASKPSAKKRYFVRYGKARAVPMSPVSLLITRLFTFWGKLRLLMEPFMKKSPPDSEPSVAEFTERRFGRDVLDYAINPFMAGVYGGDPAKLSVKYAFPPFWTLESKYGSVILGAMKSRREKLASENFLKPMMVSFEGGMRTLIDSLASELGDCLKLGAKVISIDGGGGSWEVSWGTDIEDVCETYDALVLAVPAPDLASLPLCGTLAAALAPLSKIVYAPIATYTLGFRRSDIAHKLDGFGVLTPAREKLSILGSLFVSSIFDGRAPRDCVTLTNYVGGMRHPEYAGLPQEKIEELVLKDLRRLLGVKGEPVFRKLFVWKHAIPQYNLGYGEFVEIFDSVEEDFPNIALLGSYRGGVGVSSCVDNALSCAEKLSDKIL